LAKDTTVKLNVRAINTYLLVALGLILLFSVYTLVKVQTGLKDVKAPEPPKLAQLTLTIVEAPACPDCFDARNYAAAIKQIPLTNVTEERVKHDSIEGQKLIKEYKLTRLPAAVVTGEMENITIPAFTKKDDAYIFTDVPPPYYDLATAGVVGRVAVTYLVDPGCPLCFDVNQFTAQMKQIGVAVGSEKNFEYNSHDGIALVKKYGITKVPTMLLSEDALEYELIKQAWPQAGTTESDGTLVLRNVTPPYRDLSTRQVRGLVTLTLLVDKSCTACYNASMHELVLEQSFSMKFKDVKTVDISSATGENLVAKHKITAVPTMLLDKEADAYPALAIAWQQIGTQESDGTYVFREVDLLQGVTYKDLSTGELKNATIEE